MGSILQPGFLRWDGLKFVLDPTSEIIGPPGPQGPPGPAGSGSGSSATFVYRPGGVSAPNVFTTFGGAVVAANALNGAKTTILIDTSIVSPAHITSGSYDLSGVSLIGRTNIPVITNIQLTIDDGAFFTNL